MRREPSPRRPAVPARRPGQRKPALEGRSAADTTRAQDGAARFDAQPAPGNSPRTGEVAFESQARAVGAEGDPVDTTADLDGGKQRVGPAVPDSEGVVVGARSDQAAVRAVGDADHPARVASGRSPGLSASPRPRAGWSRRAPRRRASRRPERRPRRPSPLRGRPGWGRPGTRPLDFADSSQG